MSIAGAPCCGTQTHPPPPSSVSLQLGTLFSLVETMKWAVVAHIFGAMGSALLLLSNAVQGNWNATYNAALELWQYYVMAIIIKARCPSMLTVDRYSSMLGFGSIALLGRQHRQTRVGACVVIHLQESADTFTRMFTDENADSVGTLMEGLGNTGLTRLFAKASRFAAGMDEGSPLHAAACAWVKHCSAGAARRSPPRPRASPRPLWSSPSSRRPCPSSWPCLLTCRTGPSWGASCRGYRLPCSTWSSPARLTSTSLFL